MSVTLSREIDVNAPPERVFDAFLRVSDLLSWLCDGAVVGERVGGRWGLGWYADPDSDAGYHTIGVFEELDPGRRLVVGSLVFTTPEGEEFPGMRLTVDLTRLEAGADDAGAGTAGIVGTRVGIRQEGFEESPSWDAFRAGAGPGWEKSLHDLKAWLETGRKLPGR